MAALASLLMASGTVGAETPDDSSVAFGSKVTISSLVSALQGGGYQALTSRPPNSPDVLLGVIATGIGGLRISILVMKCDKSQTDDVCLLTFIASFNDEKNILDEKNAEALNKKTAFAKFVRVQLPNGNPGFNVLYTYICKEYTDTKFLPGVLQSFAADVGKVATAYNSGQFTQ